MEPQFSVAWILQDVGTFLETLLNVDMTASQNLGRFTIGMSILQISSSTTCPAKILYCDHQRSHLIIGVTVRVWLVGVNDLVFSTKSLLSNAVL